jgi:hypothetical protein
MQFDNPDPFGRPTSPGGFNPYAPPTAYGEPVEFRAEPEGTYWGGFAAGFLAALIGLGLVYAFGKSETKRGAGHGFLVRLGIVVLIIIMV